MSLSWKARIVGGFVVVALSVAIYLLFFRGSDEERIRAQLARLAEVVEVDPAEPENPIARLGRVRGAFKELFVENVAIEIPELTALHSGRTELADAVAQAPQMWSSAKVDFASVRITLDPATRSADVTAIATLVGARSGGETTRDVRRVVLRFEKVGGDFLVARLQVAARDEAR